MKLEDLADFCKDMMMTNTGMIPVIAEDFRVALSAIMSIQQVQGEGSEEESVICNSCMCFVLEKIDSYKKGKSL